MKSKRDILLIATILAFCVTAPLVTLYTAGYRYHWKKQKLERVGFFETSSIPGAASVTIDGKLVGKTPFVDMNILPGSYDLTLSKPGYRSYTTTFDVRSGVSSLLLNVLLWKDATPELVATSPGSAALHPKGTMLAWTESIPNGTATLMSLVGGEKKRLGCVLKASTSSEVLWNESGSAALFRVTTPSGLDACVVTASGNSYLLSELVSAKVLDVEWSPFDESHLLVRTSTSGLVVAYERNETTVVSRTSNPFTIRGSKRYAIEPITSGMRLASASISTLPIPFGSESAELPSGSYRFLPSPESYIVVREEKHGRIDVFATRTLEHLVTLVAESVLFDPKNSDRFLALGTHELALYDLGRETSELVTRTSEPLDAALWHPLGSHAIVHVGTQVIAIPFAKGAAESVTLATMESAQSLWIDARGDTLLMLGTSGATTGVWKLGLKE